MQDRKQYRESYKGITQAMYSNMRARSRTKGWDMPVFALSEFREWFTENGGMKRFNAWLKMNKLRAMKPSVDRINPLLKYEFSNMQVITFKENRDKGDREKLVLWGKRIQQFTPDGELVAIYPSTKIAAQVTGFSAKNLSDAAVGRNETSNGFVWKYFEVGRRRNWKHQT
jgi:hypothetical protein